MAAQNKLSLLEAVKKQQKEILDDVMKSRDVERTLVAVRLNALVNMLIDHLENRVPKAYRG